MKSIKYGVTWGLSQSMMFYGFAAAFGFGTYLVGTLKMDFEDVFRSELVTLFFTSFYCVTFLPLPSHRVFIAMVAGGIEIGRVNAFAPDYSKAKVAAAKLFGLFDRKSLIDPTDPSGKTSVRLPVLSSMTFNQLVDKWCMFWFWLLQDRCNAHISYRDVWFHYPTRADLNILRGFNLEVKPGQFVAIVGASGNGKTTALQLLERFYDYHRGNVVC